MKLKKKTVILVEMLIFIEMYIPSGPPRLILLFNQMFYEANDSLSNLILIGVTAFEEGWKGWRGQAGTRSGTMFCVTVGRIIKQKIKGQRLIREI